MFSYQGKQTCKVDLGAVCGSQLVKTFIEQLKTIIECRSTNTYTKLCRETNIYLAILHLSKYSKDDIKEQDIKHLPLKKISNIIKQRFRNDRQNGDIAISDWI